MYPAVFYEEEGKISVIFPDLGNLATFGDNVANAMCMAGEHSDKAARRILGIPMWLNTRM